MADTEDEDELAYIKWILDFADDDLQEYYNDVGKDLGADLESFREFIACIKFHQDIIKTKEQFIKKIEEYGHLRHYEWYENYWTEKQTTANEEIDEYKKDIDRMSYHAMNRIYDAGLRILDIPKPLIDIVRSYVYSSFID